MISDRDEDRRARRGTAGPFAVEPKVVKPARDVDKVETRAALLEARVERLERVANRQTP